MEVSGIELIEFEYTAEKVILPVTHFLLTSVEQELYDSFRAKHDKLRTIHGDFSREAEEKRERGNFELAKMFSKLINPYLNQFGLRTNGGFTSYGKKRETYFKVKMLLPGKKEILLDLDYCFLTENENLSCQSHICYSPEGQERQIVYNILERILGNKEQDGINFPITSRRGDFIYFASADFAMVLPILIKAVVDKIGSERMEELKVLRRAYWDERGNEERGYSDAKIKAEAFRTAYESKLEIALVESGIV